MCSKVNATQKCLGTGSLAHPRFAMENQVCCQSAIFLPLLPTLVFPSPVFLRAALFRMSRQQSCFWKVQVSVLSSIDRAISSVWALR